MEPVDLARDALAFVRALDEMNLSRFTVVGQYTRYDETVRSALQDARQRIIAGFERSVRKRENHLVWAAPGNGKTYFVQQVAAALGSRIRYQELNLAKFTEDDFPSALAEVDEKTPCLRLVDEIDAKAHEAWPYAILLPHLDASVERDAPFVFVLAGSSSSGVQEFKQHIASRPKGADVLSRIPEGNEYEIPPLGIGDRVLIALNQLRQAGEETAREVRAVEKLALYYVALHDRLSNARRLREFAVRVVERMPATDDRIKYDHLFDPGDPDNKDFWLRWRSVATELTNRFVRLTADGAWEIPSSVSTGTRGGGTNLPRQLTSFVGREREMEEIKLLLSSAFLLTLTGAGGCGKTRLALQVAGQLVGQYGNGIWWVDLASLGSEDLVLQTVASTLGVIEQPGRPLLDTVVSYLRTKHLLLVLDNCEHLLPSCARLADQLLRHCPQVTILATSREPLGIEGEAFYRVPLLSLPDARRLPPVEELPHYEAVRLFLERAALSQPGFALTGGNAAAVVRICHLLDGIPLAIELAAARMNVLTAEQTADRLHDGFRLLTMGRRTALPQHQTLRATMDWSHDLLSPPERILLRRLSAFAGPFTLDAVEAVCSGDGLEASEILDVLTQLVQKSLVVAEVGTEAARYRQLGTIRQYGRERLMESGEATVVLRRHLAWYLALAEEADSQLRGPHQLSSLQRLETEHENLRAALAWSLASGEREAGMQLAGALQWFWIFRGYWSEGREWLERALAESEGSPPSVLSSVIRGAANLASRQGDYARQASLATRGLELSRENGDRWGVAWFLLVLGNALLHEGHIQQTTLLYREALILSRELQDKWLISNALTHVATLARAQGDYAGAGTLFAESLAFAKERQDGYQIAYTLRHLGITALRAGGHASAERRYKECLALLRQLGDRGFTAECLEGLAQVACAQEDYVRAVRLFGAAQVLGETLGMRQLTDYLDGHDRCVVIARERLGNGAFTTAWSYGQSMTLEQALAYVLQDSKVN